MTLSFSTQLAGKPTHFVEKIWTAFNLGEGEYQLEFKERQEWLKKCIYSFNLDPLLLAEVGIKIHTIRADTKNRWRVGMPIHFVVKNRTPNRFQFAPILPVKAIQEISIQWRAISCVDCPFSSIHPIRWSPVVFVDGQPFYRPYYCISVDYTIDFGKPTVVKSSPLVDFGIEELAKNEGFDSAADFFKYFNANFDGKIIHWTDYTYLSGVNS